MTDLLAVGLASWIIQDGNYGDFKRGDRKAFALEFWASAKLDTVKREGATMPSLERNWALPTKLWAKWST